MNHTGAVKSVSALITLLTVAAIMVTVPSALAAQNTSPGADLQSLPVTGSHEPVSDSSGGYSLNAADSNVLERLKDNGIEQKYIYFPNLQGASALDGRTAQLYQRSPAPMGVADYGLMEPSGLWLPYTYETDSFMGTAMFEELNAYYPLNDNPDSVSVQLNAVLSGVTVSGTSGYDFWIQNIGLYTPSTGEITFISNIWNLSGPSFTIPDNTIQSGLGDVSGNTVYYHAGPTLDMNASSTFNLYVTSGTVDGNNAVYFSYSISSTEMDHSVTPIVFDTVVFNSGNGISSSADGAHFRVSGLDRTPSGLLYDAELVIGGPGGGSMTTIYGVNGQLTLMFLNADGVYTRLPAAYNYGSNAGETSQGVSVWWSSLMKPRIHLSTGPSLLVSMWGSQVSHSGAVNIAGRIDPPNSFVFMSTGTEFDSSTAAWAPVSENGSYKFSLPGRMSYSGMILMSEYQPFNFTIISETENETSDSNHTGGGGGCQGGRQGGGEGNETAVHMNATLVQDRSLGIYTPLYAKGNDQIPFITSGNGSGTMHDPYLIENNMYGKLDPLFGKVNSFGYPQFHAMQVTGTTDYIKVQNMPEFSVTHEGTDLEVQKFLGTPASNTFNYVFRNTSGLTLNGNQWLSGWFTPFMTDYSAASVMLIDSANFLVANNTFRSSGNSLLISNSAQFDSNGTVWGNHFLDGVASEYASSILMGDNPAGVSILGSGNTVYNNYFDLMNSAYSPRADSSGSAYDLLYANDWNLTSKQPLSMIRSVNGMDLSGSIVDVGYQGGNYWSNFDGNIPYNCSGQIYSGGDYLPLLPEKFSADFLAVGLPNGVSWGVSVDGKYTGSNVSVISFELINGTHDFKIIKNRNYTTDISTGTVSISGEDVEIEVNFYPVLFEVRFMEEGLQAGTAWTVNLGAENITSSDSYISFFRQNGTYSFSSFEASNYLPDPASGSISVDGSTVVQVLNYQYKLHLVRFVATGLPADANWSVSVSGNTHACTGKVHGMMLENGAYSYVVTAPDEFVSANSTGTFVVSGESLSVNVDFSLKTYRVLFVSAGIPSGTGWGVSIGENSNFTTEQNVSVFVPAGSHTYHVSVPEGYVASVSSGNIEVNSSGLQVNVVFTKIPDVPGQITMYLSSGVLLLTMALSLAYALYRRKER